MSISPTNPAERQSWPLWAIDCHSGATIGGYDTLFDLAADLMFLKITGPIMVDGYDTVLDRPVSRTFNPADLWNSLPIDQYLATSPDVPF